MSELKIPPKGTEDATKLGQEYIDARQRNDWTEIEKLSLKYRYANKECFRKAMNVTYGIKARDCELKEVPKENEVERISYPDLKIKPFIISRRKRDKEDIKLELADHHVGKKTETYNLEVYKVRLGNLLKKVYRIIELHQPIGKLHIFDLGDGTQGENIYQGSKAGEIEGGAFEQIYDYAVPQLSSFIISVSQIVEGVEYYGVRGNHGKYGKEATPLANWDNFRFKALEHALVNQKRLHFHFTKQFYQLVNIMGFLHFIFHGDQVRTSYGIPRYGLQRKLQEWYAHVGGFHYASAGHWHTWEGGQVNEVADFHVCPPLITGDEWAVEIIGRASKPIQLCCGIHPRQGRTWEYRLYTDDDYLPEPDKT